MGGVTECGTSEDLDCAQRMALIRISRAYCTTSAEALQVICGVIPLDILADEYLHRYKIRKGIYFKSEELEYCIVVKPNVAKKELREISLRRWQERWNLSVNGRVT